jgi:DNA mismatch endonuclease (patch repair protein)
MPRPLALELESDMADVFSKSERSRIMSRIRSKHTAPELAVRKALFSRGYRFRNHSGKLPGCPDVVLKSMRTTVFVHGCFWHQHPGCKRQSVPSTCRGYWIPKLTRNVERFRQVRRDLKSLGWNVVVIWECETKSAERLSSLIDRRLPQQQHEATA